MANSIAKTAPLKTRAVTKDDVEAVFALSMFDLAKMLELTTIRRKNHKTYMMGGWSTVEQNVDR